MLKSISRPGSDENLKRYEPWYDDGSDLLIIIEDRSFRLPSWHFRRDSPIFEKHLRECQPSRTNTKKKGPGCQTIVIEGALEGNEKVTADDFANLCWVLFNQTYSFDTSLDVWKTILRLADQWDFREVKKLVFRELDVPGKFELPLVERIQLYQQFSSEENYLEPLYAQLCSRPNSLTFEEGKTLGLEAVIHITSAREELRSSVAERLSQFDPLPSRMKMAVLKKVRAILSSKSPLPYFVNDDSPRITETALSGFESELALDWSNIGEKRKKAYFK